VVEAVGGGSDYWGAWLVGELGGQFVGQVGFAGAVYAVYGYSADVLVW
jgi:hypothetical protein